MKIDRIRNLTLLAGFAVIAGSVTAWASRGGSILSAASASEVVFGSYHCGMGNGEGFTWASLQSTGDLLRDDFFLQRSIRSGNPPQEVCAELASGATQVLQEAGCSVGPSETRTDETGTSIDLAFVCHDQRSRLTQLLADLGSSILLAAP